MKTYSIDRPLYDNPLVVRSTFRICNVLHYHTVLWPWTTFASFKHWGFMYTLLLGFKTTLALFSFCQLHVLPATFITMNAGKSLRRNVFRLFGPCSTSERCLWRQERVG